MDERHVGIKTAERNETDVQKWNRILENHGTRFLQMGICEAFWIDKNEKFPRSDAVDLPFVSRYTPKSEQKLVEQTRNALNPQNLYHALEGIKDRNWSSSSHKNGVLLVGYAESEAGTIGKIYKLGEPECFVLYIMPANVAKIDHDGRHESYPFIFGFTLFPDEVSSFKQDIEKDPQLIEQLTVDARNTLLVRSRTGQYTAVHPNIINPEVGQRYDCRNRIQGIYMVDLVDVSQALGESIYEDDGISVKYSVVDDIASNIAFKNPVWCKKLPLNKPNA